MMKGTNTENVLIVSSFSKPILRIDIEDYVTAAISETNQQEYYSKYSLKSNIHFHIEMIIRGIEVKRNLGNLHELAIDNDYSYDTYPFFLIYNALDSYKYDNVQFYYDGLTKNNWTQILDKESKDWIQIHVDNKRPYDISSLDNEIELSTNNKMYELDKGKYKVHLLGGWHVKLGDFKIELINQTTKRKVVTNEPKLKEQSFISGNRSKHILSFKIDSKGIYSVNTSNSKSIKVKRSNLKISNFILRKPDIKTENLKLKIIKQ